MIKKLSRKIVALVVSLMLLFFGTVAFAADNTVRVCGGPIGLSYIKYAEGMVGYLISINQPAELVITDGGQDNVNRIKQNKCDIGITVEQMAKENGMMIIAPIFTSYAHLVCNKKRVKGATEIGDLLNLGRKPVIAVGSMTSATRYTFGLLGTLDSGFNKNNFTLPTLSFTQGIGYVMAGKIDCVFAMSGKGTIAMNAANTASSDDIATLVEVDDYDFNDSGVFEHAEFDDDVYKNIQRGSDIETISAKTVLFVGNNFMTRFPLAYALVAGEADQLGTKLFKK